MRRIFALVAMLAGAAAPAVEPEVVSGGGARMLGGPELAWAPTPLGMMGATALKAGGGGGELYVLRVRYARGERSPVHVHSDPRVVTVLRGTLLLGSGATLAPREMRTGETFLVPGGMPHYGFARDRAAERLEIGNGPSSTTVVPAVP